MWGRLHAAAVTDSNGGGPSGTEGPAKSVRQLMQLLSDFGFAPQPVTGGVRPQIGLRNCPFLELAVQREDVVCRIHLGLMQGAMESWGSSITVGRLDPFVEPDRCVAHLISSGGS